MVLWHACDGIDFRHVGDLDQRILRLQGVSQALLHSRNEPCLWRFQVDDRWRIARLATLNLSHYIATFHFVSRGHLQVHDAS